MLFSIRSDALSKPIATLRLQTLNERSRKNRSCRVVFSETGEIFAVRNLWQLIEFSFSNLLVPILMEITFKMAINAAISPNYHNKNDSNNDLQLGAGLAIEIPLYRPQCQRHKHDALNKRIETNQLQNINTQVRLKLRRKMNIIHSRSLS